MTETFALSKDQSSINGMSPAQTMALKIGVMGGATGVISREHLDKAHKLGRTIAKNGCIMITGACPDLPLAAACGAKQEGGMVVGISPGLSVDEHIAKYRSPIDFHDLLIFNGSALMGRGVVNIRSSDIIVDNRNLILVIQTQPHSNSRG